MPNPPERLTSAALARLVGYSPQQVRDLERLGVLPPAARDPNGYRRWTKEHVVVLRAYRALAAAIGPVPARRLLPVLRTSPLAEAAGQVDELHASLARERARVVEALRGLAVVVGEPDLPAVEGDAMTIGELAQALDVRPSALRHWERAGLLAPRRAAAARRYDPPAVAAARVVAALRSGGYPVPTIARVLDELARHRTTRDAQDLLDARLSDLARRSLALLEAAAALHAFLSARAEPGRRPGEGSAEPRPPA